MQYLQMLVSFGMFEKDSSISIPREILFGELYLNVIANQLEKFCVNGNSVFLLLVSILCVNAIERPMYLK